MGKRKFHWGDIGNAFKRIGHDIADAAHSVDRAIDSGVHDARTAINSIHSNEAKKIMSGLVQVLAGNTLPITNAINGCNSKVCKALREPVKIACSGIRMVVGADTDTMKALEGVASGNWKEAGGAAAQLVKIAADDGWTPQQKALAEEYEKDPSAANAHALASIINTQIGNLTVAATAAVDASETMAGSPELAVVTNAGIVTGSAELQKQVSKRLCG